MDAFVNNFQVFMLVLVRILSLFSIAPLFSYPSVTFFQRAIFSFLVTTVIFPVVSNFIPPIPGNMINFGLLAASEVIIGLIMGFIIGIIFASFQMAGEFFNVQLGFGYTEVLDPMTQVSLPIISTLKNLMALLILIFSNAYQILFFSLVYSFEKIQIYALTNQIHEGLYKVLKNVIGIMFVIAFKLSLPVLGILILITVSEALMGKAAPQLNIMQLSFPIKVVSGLIVLIFTLPFLISQIEYGIHIAFDQIDQMINSWPM